MTLKEIKFGSEKYTLECQLREEILWKPLGLSLYDEDLEKESGQFHFGLFMPDGELIACLVVVPITPSEAKIRQIAVARLHQGKGIGRRLMNKVEKILYERGYVKTVLHSQTSVVGFYAKLGYTKTGEEFMEVNIPHRKMEKDLRSSKNNTNP